MNDDFELIIGLQSGHPGYPALEYGLNLAELLHVPARILCEQTGKQDAKLDKLLAAAQARLSGADIPFLVEWVTDHIVHAILDRSDCQPNIMAVFSDVYRPEWRRHVRFGRFRRLMAGCRSPLLRVRKVVWPLSRILLCTGGLSYTTTLESLALQFAKAAGAKLTIFHVVEPVTFEYPTAHELALHWDTLLKTDTPQARNLKRALAQAQAAGVEAEVLVRHGAVVNEIAAEINSGKYDLIAMGSAYSSHSLSKLYRPDVTALVAASTDYPVLTMRSEPVAQLNDEGLGQNASPIP